MLDDPDQTERLLCRLQDALPLPAILPPALRTLLEENQPGSSLAPACEIYEVHYAGDEGGILCKVELRDPEKFGVPFVSITYLAFDPRLPLARAIAAYQKHRIKRLRRANRSHSKEGIV